MNTEKLRLKKKLGIKLIGIACLILGIFLAARIFIRPNVSRVCEYNARAITISLMDEAVSDRLDELSDGSLYGSLVTLTYSSNGNVSSIETDTALINRIKTDTLSDINSRLLSGERGKSELSVGTLLGIPVLHGTGPAVELKIEPKGYADAIFISEFSSAGINQTLHRIIMRTNVNVAAYIPMYSTEISVSGDFLIAETVIVGNIPESYTHVVSDERDIIDTINDYEAEPHD